MEPNTEQKRKLSQLERFPLSMSLTTFNNEVEKLHTSGTPVIDERRVAHLGNMRRLAVHARNNQKCYYRGKEELIGMSAELGQLRDMKLELELERRELLTEIQQYQALQQALIGYTR